MLGLCLRAGKLSAGETGALAAIRSKKARLVVISRDASENTKKLFFNKCGHYRVPVAEYGEKEALGRALGKGWISSLAVTDENFSKMLMKLMQDETGRSVNGEN